MSIGFAQISGWRFWNRAVALVRCSKRHGGTPTGERARIGGLAQADLSVARGPHRWCGPWNTASAGVPLFLFPWL